jgi:hypothetical protein
MQSFAGAQRPVKGLDRLSSGGQSFKALPTALDRPLPSARMHPSDQGHF